MFVNLAMMMREKGVTDASLSAELDMDEDDFIDKKVGLMPFTTCEKLAVSLLLGYPCSWLFERL